MITMETRPDIQSGLILSPVFAAVTMLCLAMIDAPFREARVLMAAGVLDARELAIHGLGKGSRYENARAVWLSRLKVREISNK